MDCIYFKGEENIKKVTKILENFGYACTIETIQFKEIDLENKTIKLLKQNGKEKFFHFKKY